MVEKNHQTDSFCRSSTKFPLKNTKVKTIDVVTNLILFFRNINANIRIKIYFLFLVILIVFLKILIINEQSERSNQNNEEMETQYDDVMMADYCSPFTILKKA